MSERRLGLLGGTFDPIHCGHLDLGQAAESALSLTGIVFVTANVPPHRPQPQASSHHRFAMVALAIAGHEHWRASDLELAVGAPSFTTCTLRRFHDTGFGPPELFFIIGADAFADIENWKDFPAILDRAHFAVVSRPGFPIREVTAQLPILGGRMAAPSDIATRDTPSIFLIDAPTPDVSATTIRRRAAANESLAGLMPPPVREHIRQHALYSSSLAGADTHRTPAAGRLHGQN